MFTEQQLQHKHERLLDLLQLRTTIWNDIDPDLLLTAFVHGSGTGQLPKNVRYRLMKWSVVANYEWHEFIGDRILRMLGTMVVVDIPEIDYPEEASKFQSELDRNTTLYGYMLNKGLCDEAIVGNVPYTCKMCADVFEAIFGVLYRWGYYEKGLGFGVLNHLYQWYAETWPVSNSVDQIFDKGHVTRQCQDLNDLASVQ